MEECINDYLYTNIAMELKIKQLTPIVLNQSNNDRTLLPHLKDVFTAKIEYLNEAINTINSTYGSIDNFQEIFPNDYDRFDKKEELMLNIINSQTEDFIMAVSPIYSVSVVEDVLMTNTISIEIIDTQKAIYDRLILEGDDALEYKEMHKDYYMREIKWDQVASYNEFANIPKVSINNLNVEEATNTVYKYLKQNKIIK